MTPTTPDRRWPGFSARIGQALLAPRRAADRLCAGGPGGVRDAALLLGLRVCAQRLQPLVRGVLHVEDEGLGALWEGAQQALLAARGDLVLILAGGVLLSLLAGPGERLLRPGLGVELAAQAWLGWLAVQLPGTLLLALAPRASSLAIAQRGVQAAGLCAFAVLWVLSLRQLRGAARLAYARAHAPAAPAGAGDPGQDEPSRTSSR